MKYSRLFNLCQTEGLDHLIKEENAAIIKLSEPEKKATAEKVINSTKAVIFHKLQDRL